MPSDSIVILVDHKDRDLMGAALIAYHLEGMGIACHLEPLQSWRSCLPAWRPSMILFNHLNTKALSDFSEDLHRRGVLVGVLLNEGMCLADAQRVYLSQKQHPGIHCDLFLTWNEKHREELIRNGFVSPPENVITTGVPRFDLYCEPWSSAYRRKRDSPLTHVLVNTTFAFAHFHDRSEGEQASLISALGEGKIPEKRDYKSMIAAHHRGRAKLPGFIDEMLRHGGYEITVRPHPREDLGFYMDYIAGLPGDQRERVRLDGKAPVQEAIITSDVVLNCENCTTSMETWISGKPSLTLVFERHPAFFAENSSTRSPLVSDPKELPGALENALAHPEQPEYRDARQAYLNEWIFRTDGKCALRVAEAIRKELGNRSNLSPSYPTDFPSLRRGLKSRFARLFDEPSHTQLKHWFRWKIRGTRGKHSMKYRSYLKAVRPSDVSQAMARLRSAAGQA